MKQNEMKQPLVQSAIVLVVAILIIGFVAGSGASGFTGGILSVIVGTLYTILFIFALAVAVVFSILFLFAIYIAALAIYSPDLAGSTYGELRHRIFSLFSSLPNVRPRRSPAPSKAEGTVEIYGSQAQDSSHHPSREEKTTTAEILDSVRAEIADELSEIKSSLSSLDKNNNSLNAAVKEVNETVATIPLHDIIQRTERLEGRQEELDKRMSECLAKVEELSNSANEGTKTAEQQKKELASFKTELQSLSGGIEKLRQNLDELSTLPEVDHLAPEDQQFRIFSYLEKQEDQEMFIKLVKEAVAENKTYAEIDEFLTESLPKEVDTIIKDHPSLTKEFIRDVKNR